MAMTLKLSSGLHALFLSNRCKPVSYCVIKQLHCKADSPISVYNKRIDNGELHNDEHQRLIIEHLESLHDKLEGYKPNIPPEKGFFSKLFSSRDPPKQRDQAIKKSDSPNGLYLYGSVGSGKTMLMDLFHDTCTLDKKHRVHFHQFMLSVHKKIHRQKEKMVPDNYVINRVKDVYDPIPPVAKEISEHTWLLCFDEFQVTDIGDAMIIKRLFSHLWKNGVVVIATSNRNPNDLYKNGLQRLNFLPFIPMLKANCDILNLDSGVDYRKQSLPAEGKIFFVVGEDDSEYELDKIYEDLVSRENAPEGPRTLEILNRQVAFSKTCGRILDCRFNDLCRRALGAVDYLEICQEFDTVILRDIPFMDLEKRSEARRFITLIDTFYDHKMRLICSAEHHSDNLFATSDQSAYDKHHQRVLIGDLDIQKGTDNEIASLFTGEEELFAFDRVASRLAEMQTEKYWDQREVVRDVRKAAAESRS